MKDLLIIANIFFILADIWAAVNLNMTHSWQSLIILIITLLAHGLGNYVILGHPKR